MKKGLTELVFIVDRSGSMGGLETDTIGGINATLAKNREAEGEANVSIVLFDNDSEVLVDRKPIAEVANLTDKDYQVRGCINMEGFRRRLHRSGCPQGEARRCGHGQCQGFRAMRFPRVRLQQPFPMD